MYERRELFGAGEADEMDQPIRYIARCDVSPASIRISLQTIMAQEAWIPIPSCLSENRCLHPRSCLQVRNKYR